MQLPDHFPDLPTQNAWPPEVVNAHIILRNAYHNARQIIALEDPDPLRLAYHVDLISNDVMHVLTALGSHRNPCHLPDPWLQNAAILLGGAVNELRGSHQQS
jgi:hypothetical protein